MAKGICNECEKMRPLDDKGKCLACRTSHAYSYDSYKNWDACAQWLLRRGLTEKQAEAVLLSKHMRWAGDSSNKGGNALYTTGDLKRYFESMHDEKTEIINVTLGTFGVIE